MVSIENGDLMRSQTARRTAVALLVAGLLASPLLADRAALKAEIDHTRAEIEGTGEGLFTRYGEPETARALGRFWVLIQTWTSEYLDAHPQASAREVEVDLAALARQGDLSPSAVRLTGDAVVIAIEWGFHGTVFAVSRALPQPFRVVWDIRAVAVEGPPDSELGGWAARMPGPRVGRRPSRPCTRPRWEDAPWRGRPPARAGRGS